TRKLDLTAAERPPLAGRAQPAEKEPEQLPERIEPEAARHHRVAFEMTGEKPKVRFHVELGAHQPLAVFAAFIGNLRDAVEHQHRRQRQLRIALAEKLAAAASQQVLVVEMALALAHPVAAPVWPPAFPRFT